MATHKPFRELVKPGSNFEFVGRARVWAMVSVLLVLGSIAMLFVNKQVRGDYLNWTIDFKGGTEMVFAFQDESGKYVTHGAGDVRAALEKGGEGSFDVSEFSWETDGGEVVGVLIRTPKFGALEADRAEEIRKAFEENFSGRQIQKVNWSGDRMFVRSLQPLGEQEAREFFTSQGLTMKDWDETDRERFALPEEGTGEYNTQFRMFGLDKQFADILGENLGSQVEIVQSYGVGALAGERLRNNGIKALFYATALIMLYLAFRFDVRYAPGAVAALLHDAILVVGVFAVTWTEVSLSSVAALLTVIGYSVNDTVVIFDRIRENVDRLKDKKLSRIINISLNETLARTLLTSLTLFVVTLMMNIFGTGMVANFAFAMNVGVIVGVYSSVFIAAPIMLWIHNRYYSGPARAKK